MRLDRMKEQYGIGTLREILSRLTAEGLVLAEGQRGFAAPPVTVRRLREIADLRLVLESHAFSQSFAAGDVDWEGRVVAAHHKLAVVEGRMLAGGTDTGVWKRCDCEFRQALISDCGSRVLMAAYAAVFDRYLRFLMIAACFRGEVAATEHETCAPPRSPATPPVRRRRSPSTSAVASSTFVHRPTVQGNGAAFRRTRSAVSLGGPWSDVFQTDQWQRPQLYQRKTEAAHFTTLSIRSQGQLSGAPNSGRLHQLDQLRWPPRPRPRRLS